MNISVSKTKVSITDNYLLNEGEYNINKCYFTFSEEYTDNLVKKAIFKQDNTIVEVSIINNECQIPSEVLNRGVYELRVYAYEIQDEELVLRYSPMPTLIFVSAGSYIEGAESPEVIKPSQFEEYMQALNDGLNEVANVNIDAEQLSNGSKITITDKDNVSKIVYVYNGEQGLPGEPGQPGQPGATGPAGKDGVIQYTAGDNITIENNVISATGGGDLSNYYTKSETNAITGLLTNLSTTSKTDLVSAINEVFGMGGVPKLTSSTVSVANLDAGVYILDGVTKITNSGATYNISQPSILMVINYSANTKGAYVFTRLGEITYMSHTMTTTISVFSVADKNYVDTAISNKIWIGTQEQYDNLGTYSNDTVYFIKES